MCPKPDGLKLPAKLVNVVGGHAGLGGRQRAHREVIDHKARRKAEREEKKEQRSGLPPYKRVKLRHAENGNVLSKHDENDVSELPKTESKENRSRLKSILNTTQELKKFLRIEQDIGFSGFMPRKVTGGVAAKLAEDDAEIAALEKKLGIKGKKSIPQAFIDDGLDELLEGLDGGEGNSEFIKQDQATGEDWLARNRNKAAGLHDPEAGVEILEENKHNESHFAAERVNLDSEDAFEGLDSDAGSIPSTIPRKRERENPYRAPVSDRDPNSQKYIPPSLRKSSLVGSEGCTRLRRQMQGLVNRLTEANLLSIVGDVEKLYRDNARKDVTSILVDLLMVSICEPTSLPDTLIILPAGFIAALYKIAGTDFGAEVTQRIVELFDEHYSHATETYSRKPAKAHVNSNKGASNLITLLAELYNFQVVGSNLIFDYIRSFLGTLSELNAELLLKVIQTSGPQLRQDDPSSLRDIVAMLRPIVAAHGEDNITVRTKFMIETINDLKNNRVKTGVAASALTSEHTIRMKKTLGKLNNRSIRASEPLRMGLNDIRESNKNGKWWLVGASWAGNGGDDKEDVHSNIPAPQQNMLKTARKSDSSGLDLVQLAREQRMNTDIRQAIFITIMSASDCQDAYLRLMKLKLKKVQELEIPRVLVHCSSAEDRYNPYYTLISRRLCGDRKLKMAFQFSLWDLFKRMCEENDDEYAAENRADEELFDIRQLVNVAKMYGSLIAGGSLSLTVLKNMDINYLQPKAQTFLEVLLITIFLQSQQRSGPSRDERAVVNLVSRVKETPQLIAGLKHFLKKSVAKTDIAGGTAETSTVKWACKVALRVLETDVIVDPVEV